ncbi:MAG: carboxyl transferase domain-containing protein, partial [Acutalibacteraceae bacterium]|nr:carboxyl transferase domain-containing protein [Acutalibacteraceae bacterium]
MAMEYAANGILKGIFDEGSFTELDKLMENCEVVTGYGSISGCPCYAFVQNVEINGGAMGEKQAAKLVRLYELAEKTGCPIIGVYDSNGGHIDEG